MTTNTINSVGVGLSGASGTGAFAGTVGAAIDLSSASGLPLTSGVTGILPIANGGTDVASVTTDPAASAFAGWDANLNLSANNFIAAYETTVTAAGVNTLLVSSPELQYFTGTTTQTLIMPDVSTLVLGQQFTVVNSSSDVVQVQANDNSVIKNMAANTQLIVTCISISDESNAGWSISYTAQAGSGSVTSVAASVPSVLSISGSPITTSGTLAIGYSGTALPVANGGTGNTSALTNGQLWIGHTGNPPSVASLSAGQNIDIGAGAGALTISAIGLGGFVWYNVAGTTGALAADTGYIADNAGLVTFTLPATAALGTQIGVAGNGAGGWLIAQNDGQNIVVSPNSTTVGTDGSLASANQYDSVMLLCTVADTTWIALSVQSTGLAIV